MHEALGVSPMSFEKDLAPGGVELVGATVVNGGRRHEPERNMSTTLGHSRAAFSEPRLWWGDS